MPALRCRPSLVKGGAPWLISTITNSKSCQSANLRGCGWIAPQHTASTFSRPATLPLPVNGKAPPIKGWPDIEATDALIDAGQIEYADATNTGIITHRTPAIDIDVLDPAVADELQRTRRAHDREKCRPHRTGAQACHVVSARISHSASSARRFLSRQTAARTRSRYWAGASRLLSTAPTRTHKHPTHGRHAEPGPELKA